ncbi:hypothetical protein X975_03087, partial [Stegodyphus mimosarum]
MFIQNGLSKNTKLEVKFLSMTGKGLCPRWAWFLCVTVAKTLNQLKNLNATTSERTFHPALGKHPMSFSVADVFFSPGAPFWHFAMCGSLAEEIGS